MLGEDILGVLVVARCLLEDNGIEEVIRSVKEFSINEECIVNGECLAVTHQMDASQAFLYQNFECAEDEPFPMLLQQLLVLLLRNLRDRPGSQMMVRDVNKFEKALRRVFTSRDVHS